MFIVAEVEDFIMSSYSTKFISDINKQLAEEAQRIEQELGHISEKESPLEDHETRFPQYGDTLDDSAMEVEDYSHNLTMEKTLLKELEDIRSALKRIEADKFGDCKYCHMPIEEKRLSARPTSTSCVACKKALKQEI